MQHNYTVQRAAKTQATQKIILFAGLLGCIALAVNF